MVDLKAQIKIDGAKVFCNPAEFAEEVFYYPDGDLGDQRTFSAVVIRGQEAVPTTAGEGEFMVVEARVAIPNSTDVTLGLTSIDRRKDLADIVLAEGGAKVRVAVRRLFSADDGLFVVGVVK